MFKELRLSISSASSDTTITPTTHPEMHPEYSRVSLDSNSTIDQDKLLEKGILLEHEPLPRLRSDWSRFRALILALTILSGLFLMAFASLLRLQYINISPRSPVPTLPTETVVFRNYTDFYDPPTPENNAMWMSLLGPAMGFAAIKDPSTYRLPAGNRNSHLASNVEIYGISMYHQLHCLIMIRDVYWRLLRSEIVPTSDSLPEDVKHTNHCFDYIRQGIMCAGDMSLEGLVPGSAARGFPHIDGMGQPHECKSFDASRAWMDAHLPF